MTVYLGSTVTCQAVNMVDGYEISRVNNGLSEQQGMSARQGTACWPAIEPPDLLLWLLCAGGSIEAVLIPMVHRRGTRRHITLCVSSQVRIDVG